LLRLRATLKIRSIRVSENQYELLNKLGLLDPTKQGILAIISSVLVFFSMRVLNDGYKWSYTPSSDCLSAFFRCDGVIGLGFNMSEWAVFSFIGVAVGLVRIFVINSK
jgi:hypothetical protein